MYKTKAAALKHLAAGENFKNKVFDLFRGDKEVVLAAISEDFEAFLHASNELKSDKEFVLAAVEASTDWEDSVFKFASSELRADKEVVLAAVSLDSAALYHASEELQADKEFVLAAVSENGYALQFVSPALQNDKEVVLTAVSQYSRALWYASDEIRELVGDSSDPAAILQSLIEKEKLEAKMAARGIKINQERDRDVGFAL